MENLFLTGRFPIQKKRATCYEWLRISLDYDIGDKLPMECQYRDWNGVVQAVTKAEEQVRRRKREQQASATHTSSTPQPPRPNYQYQTNHMLRRPSSNAGVLCVAAGGCGRGRTARAIALLSHGLSSATTSPITSNRAIPASGRNRAFETRFNHYRFLHDHFKISHSTF
ncbi:hypothetical protein BC828DRAFT_223885 [Blastocladiella britannica]|nr:hypothetical protein BC828DRAFT_223885 [Blastocladiella britannica]